MNETDENIGAGGRLAVKQEEAAISEKVRSGGLKSQMILKRMAGQADISVFKRL